MKLKKIVLSVFALLGAVVLVACSTSATKNTTDLQRLVPGQSDIRNHIEYQGDKMTLLKSTTTVLYSALGANSEEDAKKKMSEFGAENWDGIKGITHEVVYKDDRVIETTTIDLNKVDFDKLGELMPLQTANGEKAKYLSYKLTKDNLITQGFKEIKDGKFEELK